MAIFWQFLWLGCTSFGGPIAHIGYFRHQFVTKNQWVDDQQYSDLVAMCQFLPGPASSQVGMAIGYLKGGISGAILAWLGFTLPSAALLIFFAFGTSQFHVSSEVIHGLKLVAVAVVAHAIWGMAKSFCQNRLSQFIAVLSCVVMMLAGGLAVQFGVIIVGGLFFLTAQHFGCVPQSQNTEKAVRRDTKKSKRDCWRGTPWLLAGATLLFLFPVSAHWFAADWLAVADVFYRVGATVLGGGHVVLPMLHTEVAHIIGDDQFLAGYALAQTVPGPLFTFAAYLGVIWNGSWWMGCVAVLAIFLPSFFLVFGVLPFWDSLRQFRPAMLFLKGVNAAVVGILLAVFFSPLWQSTVLEKWDFAAVLVAFSLLQTTKTPPLVLIIALPMLTVVIERIG